MRHHFLKFSVIGLSFALAGCASLLPHATQVTKSPWADYAEAQAVFAKIVPEKTSIAELKELGIDPTKTSNVAILNHADLLRRLVGSGSFDIGLLDSALRACLSSQSTCFAYEIEQTFLDKKRVGNFWLDVFNFKKRTNISGWQFDAIIVVNDDKVIYKLWSGKPHIHQLEEERNPLGPFQGFGPTLLQQQF